jgi:hypothetical protein
MKLYIVKNFYRLNHYLELTTLYLILSRLINGETKYDYTIMIRFILDKILYVTICTSIFNIFIDTASLHVGVIAENVFYNLFSYNMMRSGCVWKKSFH